MKLSDIILRGGFNIPQKYNDTEILRVVTDPEYQSEGAIFVSLHSDHEKEKRAVECGAAAILCEGGKRELSVPVIYTENVRASFAAVCKLLSGFDERKTKLIGVTGTNGKTSVGRLIYGTLKGLGYKCGFIGTGKIEIHEKTLSDSFYSMTTPDPVTLYPALRKMNDAGCEYAVMEVSSHSLYFDKVSPLQYEVSVFTNLSREHGDFHKTIEDYYQAKRKLANISKKMIVNMDDPYGQRMYTECEGAVGVGAIYDADVQIKSIRRCDFSGSEYLYSGGNFVFIAKTRLPGIFNVYNTALALTAVTELGIKPCLAKRALSKLEGVAGRFEIIAECPTVIIDYAHTPMALETVLCAIKQMTACNRITLVFGGGGERDKEKRPEMAKIAEKYAKNIIVTTDNPRNESKDSIIKDITRGFTEKAQYKVINDRTEAINYAIDNASDDEIIAIVGKGAEDYIIDKYGYRPYSDKACATEAISRRKRKNKSANKA